MVVIFINKWGIFLQFQRHKKRKVTTNLDDATTHVYRGGQIFYENDIRNQESGILRNFHILRQINFEKL